MALDAKDCRRFVDWLLREAVSEARGDRYERLKVSPSGRFWLGRLAPETNVINGLLGERGERLDPCESGFYVRPTLEGGEVVCKVQMVAWRSLPETDATDADKWEKTNVARAEVRLRAPTRLGETARAGQDTISEALSRVGAVGLSAEIQLRAEMGREGPRLSITVVNTSPDELEGFDTNLYQVELEADVGETVPFLLDELEDSFRYDRRIAAYGINGGVTASSNRLFRTIDYASGQRMRPEYWDDEVRGDQPDLSFRRLSADPLEPLQELSSALAGWTSTFWARDRLSERRNLEAWSEDMFARALEEAQRAKEETQRVASGISLLEGDEKLRRAFALANRSFEEAPAVPHEQWRPFQLGFALANLPAIAGSDVAGEREYVDTLWFATGGGKTETYLLMALVIAFYDRLSGKKSGISAWARFPLRMLSLQQTQRFADVIASAELVRNAEKIAGDQFSLGFLVGEAGSPNRLRKNPQANQADYRDPDMPRRYRVLIRCPLCMSTELEMRFDEDRWALDHLCANSSCPSNGKPLPFRIVDDEIYRWLPTVVVGTIDKAAMISMQAAMRGFYGAPHGKCPAPHHGFTYAPRGESPKGCLFPGCSRNPEELEQEAERFAPDLRMQDELHLLRDSLGSVDSHYEALLDGLQTTHGRRPKLIGSSATIAGHEQQVSALYRREGRIFPLQGPRATRSFWSQESATLSRHFVGLAPRGVTLEYANDQLLTTMQNAIRLALKSPGDVAADAGVPASTIDELVSAYGVNVVYGSTIKDVEAAARSFQAQIPIAELNDVTLTGRTPFEEVRSALERLAKPESEFTERIHVVAASSMLSHGVDLDRLNVMVMLGLPLSTSEFIQTTSRVGRTFPGLVFVLHKIGRERDAAVFRMFPSFVSHMDRLIDAVPITNKSRRVLELTFPGLEQGRIYGIHEHEALSQGMKQLTLPSRVRSAFTRLGVGEQDEADALIEWLGFEGDLDEYLRRDVVEYMRSFYQSLNDVASTAEWVRDLFWHSPMRSLRDVEEQVPVFSRGGGSR